LETFSLRQQLDVTRKELALALYQHDAACRVIARLMKEKEEAVNLLKEFKLSVQQNGHAPADHANHNTHTEQPADNSMDVSTAQPEPVAEIVEIGVTENVIAELNATCKALSSTRKQRKASDKLLPKDAMVHIQEKASYTPHAHGITSVAVKNDFVHDGASQSVIFAGSEDHTATLSALADGKVYCQLTGHSGKVNKVAFSPSVGSSVLFTASEDRTVRMWTSNGQGGYQEDYQYTKHNTPVVGLTIHPTGNYFVSVGQDQDWHFVDVVRKAPLKIVHDSTGQAFQYSASSFHPDGLILGTGTSIGQFKIWDVREQKNVANLQEHAGAIQSINFSENGYLAATGSVDGFVKIWDLRKLTCTKSFQSKLIDLLIHEII
jgi:pre-mRNA-processing factor 19